MSFSGRAVEFSKGIVRGFFTWFSVVYRYCVGLITQRSRVRISTWRYIFFLFFFPDVFFFLQQSHTWVRIVGLFLNNHIHESQLFVFTFTSHNHCCQPGQSISRRSPQSLYFHFFNTIFILYFLFRIVLRDVFLLASADPLSWFIEAVTSYHSILLSISFLSLSHFC